MKTVPFSGVATALVTPFHSSSEINYEVLKELIESQMQSNINAILIAGTTGEACTLSFDEYSRMIAFCSALTQNKTPLIVGSGSNDTAKAIKLSLEAEKRGADALLIVTPYYNKPTQEGLIKHYFSIADRINIPIILYTVPARTGVSIEKETLRKLSSHPNIVGIKVADKNTDQILEWKNEINDLAIYCGNDNQILSFLAQGADGIISVASNIIPIEILKIYQHFKMQDFSKAITLQKNITPLLSALFAETNPIPIKQALELIGFNVGAPRLPLVPCSDNTKNALRKELVRFGL